MEYASKAVENGGTCIGIRCSNGIVLATEKLILSKLLKPHANKRIATIDRKIGLVSAGMIPDARHLANTARSEAQSWRNSYKTPIPTHVLASRIGSYVQSYTLQSGLRPFGVSTIIGGVDPVAAAPLDGIVGSGPKAALKTAAPAPAVSRRPGEYTGGPYLFMVEPSGAYWGYYGTATGKGRQIAKSELEKLNLHEGKLTVQAAVREAARIIHMAHEDSKDKEFELEMTWCSDIDGPTKGRHEEVPRAMLEQAEKEAKRAIEGEDEEEDEEDDVEPVEDENRMQE